MTVCITRERLVFKGKKRVEVGFDGGKTTSDGGFVVPSEVDRRKCLTDSISGCIEDKRDSRYVKPEQSDMIRQRVFQIAFGYEGCNDVDAPRLDPSPKTAAGRCPETGDDLASQPTLSRPENSVDGRDMKQLQRLLVEHFLNLWKLLSSWLGERLILNC